jgi:hypothetical protein
MRSNLLALVDVIEFQIIEAYSNLDLTKVKYSSYKQSKEDDLKVMERIRSNSYTHSENMKSKGYTYVIEDNLVKFEAFLFPY